MVAHAIDVAADDPVVLAEADLVVLAAPIQQNLEILAELPEHVAGSAVVTDTGSSKRSIVMAAASLPPRLTFVGGHPLGGAARSGIEHARPDLFKGRPWLFTPTGTYDLAVIDKLKAFAAGLGAVPRILTPNDHDRVLAFISHLPQLTVSALMHVVGTSVGEEGLALSGRGLQDTTRLASSPAGIWREVCASNADEVGAALDALIAILNSLRSDLETGEAVDEVFDSANRWRETLLSGLS
jgi:prephenate dehydrogenase